MASLVHAARCPNSCCDFLSCMLKRRYKSQLHNVRHVCDTPGHALSRRLGPGANRARRAQNKSPQFGRLHQKQSAGRARQRRASGLTGHSTRKPLAYKTVATKRNEKRWAAAPGRPLPIGLRAPRGAPDTVPEPDAEGEAVEARFIKRRLRGELAARARRRQGGVASTREGALGDDLGARDAAERERDASSVLVVVVIRSTS